MSELIILGASTRAAATSARRAGWTPWCADLFADADLRQIATVHYVGADVYPEGLIAALVDAPPAPVMYTGALDNRPNLVARIDRPLWGNPPEVLRTIRSPQGWTRYLRDRHVRCPHLAESSRLDGSWLLKPRRSAGGIGILDYVNRPFNERTHFLQQRIEGEPCSATFLGTEQSSSLCIGFSKQLIGKSWLNATGYHYCGNIGPMSLDDDVKAQWQHIGNALAGFPLRGLFGVDAIIKDGIVWPVEINPRYTASMEMYERSYRTALLPLHRAVFERTPWPAFAMPATPVIWGKAILYAQQTLAFPADGPWLDALHNDVDLDTVEYADIPHAGEIIEQGRPVLTLFASSSTVADCEMKLQEKARTLDLRLWG